MQTRKLLLYLLPSLVLGFLPATLRADVLPQLVFTEVSDTTLTVQLDGADSGQVSPFPSPSSTDTWLWDSGRLVDPSNIPIPPVSYYWQEPGQTTVNKLTIVQGRLSLKDPGKLFAFLVQSDVNPPDGVPIIGNGDVGPTITLTNDGQTPFTFALSFTDNANEPVPDAASTLGLLALSVGLIFGSARLRLVRAA
jgi:hypothetical protein